MSLEAWLDAALAGHGLRRTGELTETRRRPWGAVHRAATTGGTVWLKVPAPATRFEVALHEVLAAHAPERVLVPLATDVAGGRLLLPDGGPSLAERHRDDPGARRAGLEAALPRYAELQRAMAPHVDALLHAGVADLRPRRTLEALASLGPQRPPGLDEAALAVAAERLADAPGGASLDHDDLHAGNLLPDRGLVAYDWGDAVVAHPFASLLVPLGLTRAELGCADDDPRLTRLRDAYLEPWGDLASPAELHETVALACRVAHVARAVVWHRAAAGDPQWAGGAHDTLLALADPSPYALG